MKKITLLLILHSAFCILNCSAQPVLQWLTFYADTADYDSDNASALGLDTLGNVYVGGWSHFGPSVDYNDYTTVKYNSSGIEQWHANHDGNSNIDDKIYAVAVSPDGNVFVTGSSWENIGGWNFVTIQYNTSGSVGWINSFNGPFTAVYDQGTAIAIGPSGYVYASGVAENGAHHDFVTVKYNASTGVRLWEPLYDGPGSLGEDITVDIAVDNAECAYVTGYSNETNTATDFATCKYHPAGNLLWAMRYDGGDSLLDRPTALVLDAGANVYVTGFRIVNSSTGDFDAVTIKYDSSGTQQWLRTFDSMTGDDRAYDVTVDNAGNIIVAGFSSAPFPGGYTLIKYDTAGNTLWDTVYASMADTIFGSPKKILTDAGNNIYFAGNSPFSGQRMEIIKVNPSGILQWRIIYYGPGGNSVDFKDFALDNAGDIYAVVNTQDILNRPVFATMKYSQFTSVTENAEAAREWLIFPNPATNELRIKNAEFRIESIEIYNTLGEKVYSNAGTSHSTAETINITALSSGIYFVRVKTSDGMRAGRFVKE